MNTQDKSSDKTAWALIGLTIISVAFYGTIAWILYKAIKYLVLHHI